MPGTQQKLLDKILSWATSDLPKAQPSVTHPHLQIRFIDGPINVGSSEVIPSDERIVCLRGTLGSGKSTIAQTVADQLQAKGCLAASYFASDSRAFYQDRLEFVVSLASQIAQSIPVTRALIAKTPPTTKSLSRLLDDFIYSPLRQVTLDRPYLIVIDSDSAYDNEFAQFIVHFFNSSLDTPLRFLLSFRGLWRYKAAGNVAWPSRWSDGIHRENLDDYKSEDDIAAVVRYTLGEALLSPELGPQLAEWPDDEKVTQLVKLAEGSFEHMAILLDFILKPHSSDDRRTFEDRLRQALSGASEIFRRALDRRYKRIIEGAEFTLAANSQSHHIRAPSVDQFVFGLVEHETPALVPLPDLDLGSEYATARDASLIASSLQEIVMQRGAQVALFHTSVRDFILDEERSGDLFPSSARASFLERRVALT